jgi:hypothetical protein
VPTSASSSSFSSGSSSSPSASACLRFFGANASTVSRRAARGAQANELFSARNRNSKAPKTQRAPGARSPHNPHPGATHPHV